MEPSLLTSLIGIFVFYILMYLGFNYSSGKWSVSDEKKEEYDIWVNSRGRKVKKSIIILSIIYGLLMFFQIYNLNS